MGEPTPRKVNMRKYLMLIPTLFFVILFLVIPILIIVSISFYTFTGIYMTPKFTLENYKTVFLSPVFLDRIAFTVRMSAIVTAVCFAMGFPVSYFMAMHIRREEFNLIIILLLLVPWWIDYTVKSMAWIPVLGRTGLLNIILVGLGLLREPSGAFIFSEFAALMVMIQGSLLFMIGPIFLSLTKIEKGLLHAAESLGASRAKAFYHIVFKMAMPGIVVGSIFVFVISLADFATPRLIGGTIITIGLAIFNQITVLNWPLASALSVVLISITLGLVYLMLKLVDIKKMVF